MKHTPYVDRRPVQECVMALREKKRWCISCGIPKINFLMADWVVRCPKCFDAKLPATFCKSCGENLFVTDRTRAMWGMRHGNEVKQCYMCKTGMTKPHPVFGVICPRTWNDPEDFPIIVCP